MNNKQIFDNYLTNQYSKSENVDFNNDTEIISLLKRNTRALDCNLGNFFRSSVDKNIKILDLGCGYGNFLYFLKTHGYKRVIGVDTSIEEVKVCKRIFKSYKLVHADIFDYFENVHEKFDVIYLSHVLEHIPKDKIFNFISGVKKILNTNGIFIIVVPNSAAYFNSGVARYVDITHEIGFTDKSLRQILILSGFSNIDIRNFYGPGRFFLNMLRKILLYFFEIFIQVLGYEKQLVNTPSIVVIVNNN